MQLAQAFLQGGVGLGTGLDQQQDLGRGLDLALPAIDRTQARRSATSAVAMRSALSASGQVQKQIRALTGMALLQIVGGDKLIIPFC